MKYSTFCFGHDKLATLLCCVFQYTPKEDDELAIVTKQEKCTHNSNPLWFSTVASNSAASTMISQSTPGCGGTRYLNQGNANGDTSNAKAKEICDPVSKRVATLVSPNSHPNLTSTLNGRPIPHYPNPSSKPSTWRRHTITVSTALLSVQPSLVGKQTESIYCASSPPRVTVTGSTSNPPPVKPFRVLPLSYHNKDNIKYAGSVARLNVHRFKCTTTKRYRMLSKLKYYVYPDMVQL
jgi:hypothetical protein